VSFVKGIVKYLGLIMLSGWMFFIGLLVGRGTAPVQFDTGWFQERLAMIFDDSKPEESVLEKPELDFYVALQKSDTNEDYDLKLQRPSVSEDGTAPLSEVTPSDLTQESLQKPLKRSRKAMTSKLAGKQIVSGTKPTADGGERLADGSSGSTGDGMNLKRLFSRNRQSGELGSVNKEQTNVLSSRSGDRGGDAVSDQQPVTLASRSDKIKSTSQSEEIKGGQLTAYSYTIQIASFPSEADAQNHIAKLGEKGYSAYKSSGMVGDKIWYRIRIGSFNNITEANASLKKLEESGIKGLIIQKD